MYELGCVWIKSRGLKHEWFKLHAPKLVHIFYSAIKDGYICFILILTRQYRLCLYNALHKFLRKLILTGCRFVTRNVKVINMDLEHWLKDAVTAIFYCINETLLAFFFVHRRQSRDRFKKYIFKRSSGVFLLFFIQIFFLLSTLQIYLFSIVSKNKSNVNEG